MTLLALDLTGDVVELEARKIAQIGARQVKRCSFDLGLVPITGSTHLVKVFEGCFNDAHRLHEILLRDDQGWREANAKGGNSMSM